MKNLRTLQLSSLITLHHVFAKLKLNTVQTAKGQYLKMEKKG